MIRELFDGEGIPSFKHSVFNSLTPATGSREEFEKHREMQWERS